MPKTLQSYSILCKLLLKENQSSVEYHRYGFSGQKVNRKHASLSTKRIKSWQSCTKTTENSSKLPYLVQAVTKAAQKIHSNTEDMESLLWSQANKKQAQLIMERTKIRHGCQSYSMLCKLLLKQHNGSLEHCRDEIRFMGFQKRKRKKKKEKRACFVEYGMDEELAWMSKLQHVRQAVTEAAQKSTRTLQR